jgi:hypothetical protein
LNVQQMVLKKLDIHMQNKRRNRETDRKKDRNIIYTIVKNQYKIDHRPTC